MKIYPQWFAAICWIALLVSPLAQAQATCTPEHAAMGHCKMDEPKTETVKPEAEAAKPEPAKTESNSEAAPLSASVACTPEHAAMGHCKMDEPKADKPKEKSKAKKKASSVEKVATRKPKRMTATSTSCTAEHAAMGHCTMPRAKPAPPVAVQAKAAPKPASTCTPEHAAMGHCSMDTPSNAAPVVAKPASSCLPEHAAMGHCTMDAELPVSDGSAETNIPMPYHAAMDMNDDPVLTKLMIDRFEVRDTQHGKPIILEADAWFGKSIDKLWLKTDIEAVDGELEEAQVQVLYNRAISPFWDLQAGIRHDFKPATRTWAVLGVQGTAPYFIDTHASLFLGKSGQTALNLSAEKEVMLTQKTVLSPEVAMTIYGKDDHELGVGSGVADLNLGLRLSYELKREFAPYVGVNWAKKFGKTAEMAEHHGEKTQDTQFLVGIQAWF